MLSVHEARERILAHFQPVPAESIPLIACAGRVLADDIAAAVDLPLFDNSSMDGFALRSSDSTIAAAASRVTLRVVADIPAGSASQVVLGQGQAARIMTGAQLPQGADSVIPVEDTDFEARDAGTPAPQTVSFTKSIQSGENVRPRGMDLRAGQVVLQKGRVLQPQDLGLLATLGIAHVTVFRKPRLALLSSGDELIEVDVELEAGKIHDSNSYTLAALVTGADSEVLLLGVAKDTRESIRILLEQAVNENVDLILSSAGVSVGAFDYIKEVIESQGGLDFWRVNMRPGKPLAFGQYRGVKFIGLPGNPVSAFVGFEVFVRPVLEKLSGRAETGRLKSGAEHGRRIRARCEEQVESDGRESYLRARIRETDGVFYAKLTGHQGSANLLSLVQADALLIIPAGVKCVPAGQEVEALLL
jgi:molybdopterin molybdotransferase